MEDKKVKGVDGPQTIVRLETKNVKRVKAVQIKPDGNLVVLGGNNLQGKTSVLDSIAYALGGGRAICDKPLREGEKKGHVIVETEDLVVRRSFTNKGGGSLKVTLQDGRELKPPQTVLDKLCGTLTFDPLKFMRQDRTAQAKTLRELLGLDLSELDQQHKNHYDERALKNRELKSKKARLDGCVEHTDVGYEELSITELMEEGSKAIEHNNEIARKEDELESKRTMRAQCMERIEKLEAELKKENEMLDQIVTTGTRLRSEVDGAERVDTKAIDNKIKHLKELNEKVRENQELKRLEEEVTQCTDEVDKQQEQMEAVVQRKNQLIGECKMPVDGLSFNMDGEVTLNNLPLDQSSGAEGLHTSVALGMAQKPKVKIMLVRDASLLDEESMKQLATIADEEGMQFWVERVGDGDDNAIIIEDGMVAE